MAAMSRIIGSIAAAILLAAGAGAAPAAEPVDLELVLAVDVSASMDREEFALQRAGYVAAIADPAFAAAIGRGFHGRIALAYVEWSGAERQRIIVPWRAIGDAASARGFAADLAAAPIAPERGTSISAALLFATAWFDGNGFAGERRVIDVSGDGPNNYGLSVVAARDLAVAAGVVVNGLPILIRPSPILPEIDLYYRDCVIGGPGAFIVPVRSAAAFADAIRRKLLLEVAGVPPPALVILAAAGPPADCLAGERARERYADPYYPGLDH